MSTPLAPEPGPGSAASAPVAPAMESPVREPAPRTDAGPSAWREDDRPGTDAVSLAGVRAGYDGRPALESVTLRVGRGSLAAIVGPNGGGKTTLLKLVAGLLRPWSGTILVLDAPPGREARRVAYVPQAELVDWSFPVSVWDVAMMGRFGRIGPIRRPSPSDRDAVSQALERVGMAGAAHVQIGSLSGGQRRRAFLARALAAEPELYLLDEPVTGVDLATEEDLMGLLRLEARAGKTVLASTHDLAAAAEHFDSVVGVNRTITAHGPASIVLDPDVLARTYGGHLLVLGSRAVVLDDAHHHDAASGRERHYHEGGHR